MRTLSRHGFTGPRKSRGQMTSIELAIVVAIIAIIVAGIVYFVAQARSEHKVTNAVSNLSFITQKAQGLYGQSATGFGGGTFPSDLISNGVIPQSLVNGANVVSPFGGAVTFTAANLYGTDDGLDINYAAVPTGSECSTFVQNGSRFATKAEVGGTTVMDKTAGTALSPTALGTACDSATGNSVAVDMVIGRG